MDFPHIPQETIDQLQMVRVMVADDPDCLDREDCPYPEVLKELFRPFTAKQGQQGGEEEGTTSENLDLSAEIESLGRQLEEFRSSLGSEDTKELNTYFRLKTTLLEKLTALRERANNVAQVEQFKKTVLAVLENEMDKDQRTRVLQQFQEYT